MGLPITRVTMDQLTDDTFLACWEHCHNTRPATPPCLCPGLEGPT